MNQKILLPFELLYKLYTRKINSNNNFTMISNNCFAGSIYKQLGVKFNTPTIGLFIYPKDYIKFVKNLEHYICMELEFIEDLSLNYPIAKIDDIKIHFLHYKSREEALKKWNYRKKRINLSNMYIVLIDRDGCTDEDIIEFSKIDYDKKIIFSNKQIDGIDDIIILKEFKDSKGVGTLVGNDRWIYRKYINIARWLN